MTTRPRTLAVAVIALFLSGAATTATPATSSAESERPTASALRHRDQTSSARG